jgi:small neutral amino acid transporter SnatA (MarC family)
LTWRFFVVLSISAVLLFGVASVFAVRNRSASVGAGVVLFLFGFYAATTGAATPVNQLMATFAHTLAQLHS